MDGFLDGWQRHNQEKSLQLLVEGRKKHGLKDVRLDGCISAWVVEE